MSTRQSAKHTADPCGDVVRCRRTAQATTIVCADGIGSGVKANVAAEMGASRLLALFERDFSLRDGFAAVAHTMTRAMGSDLPFVAFSVARIQSDGRATILSYESPPPIFIGRRSAQVVHHRMLHLDQALISEAQCHLEPGEGLLLCSDGITQAGLGNGLPLGWEAAGVCQYLTDLLADGVGTAGLSDAVHDRARALWGAAAGDDCTAVVAHCRPGRTVNVLTGPPADRAHDGGVVQQFLRSEGHKIVCGATTAKIVARTLGRPLTVEQTSDLIAPPAYRIDGVDLVTEGAVTLNQVYNLLDENPATPTEVSGVSRLVGLLRDADRVRFTLGGARNPAEHDIAFRQQGILPRRRIVTRIAEALRACGKLVIVEPA